MHSAVLINFVNQSHRERLNAFPCTVKPINIPSPPNPLAEDHDSQNNLVSKIPDFEGQQQYTNSFQEKLDEIDQDLRRYELLERYCQGKSADTDKENPGMDSQ